MEKQIRDRELGVIMVRRNARAQRYSLRVCDGTIVAVLPMWGSEQTLLKFIARERSRLIEMIRKQRLELKELLGEGSNLQTRTFRLRIVRAEREDFAMRLSGGVLRIACPRRTNFGDKRVQGLLKEMVSEALREEAQRLLPRRLSELAKRHGFKYCGPNITGARTRWGSCNARRNISLSYSLMLLPGRLIDYVLLHELCHTVEMNHGERFWALMERVTGGKVTALRKELRGRRML